MACSIKVFDLTSPEIILDGDSWGHSPPRSKALWLHQAAKGQQVLQQLVPPLRT